MKILTWAIRLTIFLFLFAFAVHNTETASVRLFFGQVWQAPLAMVLLIFFVGGALLGVLALLGTVFSQRREIARLQRELGRPAGQVPGELPPAP